MRQFLLAQLGISPLAVVLLHRLLQFLQFLLQGLLHVGPEFGEFLDLQIGFAETAADGSIFLLHAFNALIQRLLDFAAAFLQFIHGNLLFLKFGQNLFFAFG